VSDLEIRNQKQKSLLPKGNLRPWIGLKGFHSEGVRNVLIQGEVLFDFRDLSLHPKKNWSHEKDEKTEGWVGERYIVTPFLHESTMEVPLR
jgi:hypothetical protein